LFNSSNQTFALPERAAHFTTFAHAYRDCDTLRLIPFMRYSLVPLFIQAVSVCDARTRIGTLPVGVF